MVSESAVTNINVSIIDQQVRQLAEERFATRAGDEHKRRSAAFVFLCVKTLLDLEEEEALDCLTDGGQDAAVDALHVGDTVDGEFRITLFQGKYKQRLDGEAAFSANEIKKMAVTIQILFDPDKPFHAHAGLQERVEEIRSLVRDGYLPSVRVVLCNNGKIWGADGQACIDAAGFPAEQVSWEHLGPDRLVDLMRPQASVSGELRLAGRIVVEGFQFRRVLIGKLPVSELAALFERHGDRLLEKNIRRYLGYKENRVNRDIAKTLRAADQRPNFYFFNNGVTMVCNKFRHNELQESNHLVRVEGMQVINGGQTCHTISRVVRANPNADYSQAYVLLRLYEMEDDERELIRDITYATNSQNPVELRDLRANDPVQQRLEMGLEALGVHYLRKRGGPRKRERTLEPSHVAEAVLAVWRRMPHLARFDKNRHFGNLYELIFSEELSPPQVIVAVDILDQVEERRKQADESAPRFVPYASHVLAMLIGEALLDALGIELSALDHVVLERARERLRDFDALYARALLKLRIALRFLGVEEDESSLQKLSATFRRGDLMDVLSHLDERIADALPALEAEEEKRKLLKRQWEDSEAKAVQIMDGLDAGRARGESWETLELLLHRGKAHMAEWKALNEDLTALPPVDWQLLAWMRELTDRQ